ADEAHEARSLRRIGLRKDQCKFVATGAESGVRRAERLSERGRRGMKNFVAARMAALVVHFLEVVQIQRAQAGGMRIAARTIQFFSQSFVEQASVVQASQWIGDGI